MAQTYSKTVTRQSAALEVSRNHLDTWCLRDMRLQLGRTDESLVFPGVKAMGSCSTWGQFSFLTHFLTHFRTTNFRLEKPLTHSLNQVMMAAGNDGKATSPLWYSFHTTSYTTGQATEWHSVGYKVLKTGFYKEAERQQTQTKLGWQDTSHSWFSVENP